MGWKGVNLHVLLVVMWLMVLSLVTATICILLPGVEHRMREAFVEMQTHRPLESYRHFRYLAKMEELQSWLDMWEKGDMRRYFCPCILLSLLRRRIFTAIVVWIL